MRYEDLHKQILNYLGKKMCNPSILYGSYFWIISRVFRYIFQKKSKENQKPKTNEPDKQKTLFETFEREDGVYNYII